MSATSIDTILLVSSGPNSTRTPGELYRVPPQVSFRSRINSNIRTLSTNGVSNKDQITGLLYVPDLDPSDPCIETSKSFTPANVTRQSDLPSREYGVIALAPWISANCTLSYLAAARRDSNRAFIVYPTDHSSEKPPSVNDPLWGLNDGGQWKSKNGFPVYAIPGQIGDGLMSNLARHSGSITEIEHGDELAEIFGPQAYARLYTGITTNYRTPLPSFWMLLWIVIAVVLVLTLTSTSVMYCILRKRRASLRRRVVNGEVDLEGLGIKQLTVPKSILDKMPRFIYTGEDNSRRNSTVSGIGNNHTEATTEVIDNDPPLPSSQVNPDDSTTPPQKKSFSQSTCPICLDDFVSHTTIVRELQPCNHIYHPECIDSFLQQKSSLCPMCKTSVLPRGYCPKNISLTTVRREYLLRQQNVRQGGGSASNSEGDNNHHGRQESRRGRVRRYHGVGLVSLHHWLFGGRGGGARRNNDPRRTTLLLNTSSDTGGGVVQLNQITTTSTEQTLNLNPNPSSLTTTNSNNNNTTNNPLPPSPPSPPSQPSNGKWKWKWRWGNNTSSSSGGGE